MVLRGALRRSGRPRPVQERPGRPRERAGGPRPRRRCCGRSSTSAATAGRTLCTEPEGEVKRSLQCPYHAWTYALDGKLIAAPNLASLKDATGAGIDRYRYGLVPVALTEWLGYAWVCLADEPPSFADEVVGDVTDRLGDPDGHRPLRHRGPDGRSPGGLRRGGQLEAHRRELHGVLPLRHHPPRAHRGAARSSPRAWPRSTTSATAPNSVRRYRVSPSTAARGSTRLPGITETRTAGTTRSPSSRRCSSTWCPTTSSSTGCTRWRADRTIVECDWLYTADVVSRRAATSPARSSCSTGSTSRTSRPASAPSPRCRRAPTATAVYSFLPNTTSRSSTSG